MSSVVFFIFVFIFSFKSLSDELYKEKWRPQYHFTPPKHWMNDPNGLSHFKGEYHMFFQYNAEGIIIANQSWGHAVSTDMVYWEYKGIAIPRFNKSYIFSGCAVVYKDTLNAIYTVYHETESGIVEDEYLSVSKDGHLFEPYPSNPILTHHSSQLQDPKVIRYNDLFFVMSIAIPDDRVIQFYKSNDLIHWEYLSEFGNLGSVEYHWEMPVLAKLNNSVYLLIVNVGYYSQYFLGNFDGKTFTPFEKKPKIRLMDYGPDFFETQTFFQSPSFGNRVVLIANVVNYHYALSLPTTIWRNTQSLPRRLGLRKLENGEYTITLEPIVELLSLRTGKVREEKDVSIKFGEAHSFDIPFSKTMEIEMNGIQCSSGDCDFELKFHIWNQTNQQTRIGVRNGSVFLDRKDSGLSNFSKYFQDHTRFETPRFVNGGESNFGELLSIRVYVDWSTIEVFVNNGEYTLTAVFFPEYYSTEVQIENNGKNGILFFQMIRFHELSSIH